MTKKFAVLGAPISHSLSPKMHNSAFKALNIDATYEAVRCEPNEFEFTLNRLAAEAYSGLNLTVPLKQLVLKHCHLHSSVAMQIGAVNCVRYERPDIQRRRWQLLGTNTDGDGLVLDWDSHWDLSDRACIILGAGGAARSAVYAALIKGMTQITLVNRTRSRAESLVTDFAELIKYHQAEVKVVTREEFSKVQTKTGRVLVVNATSLGLRGENAWFDGVAFDPDCLVYDMIYSSTPLQELAEQSGCRWLSGKGMLVQQGALSWLHWFDEPPELKRIQAALSRGLNSV